MKGLEKNPNPTKDQHFMVDQDMLNLIYETASIEPKERIVEIGGGAGALTDYLVKGDNHVTVIEKDPYYANLLKNKYSSYKNVEVIDGDALTFNFSDYDRIVANLPYTITEPFLINLAKSGALNYNPSDPKSSLVKSITLVLSQNSTRKMVAPVQLIEGNSRHQNQEFGIMSAICKSFCDVDIVSSIPSEAFFPEPAVTSFLVNLTPKKEKTTVDRIIRELLIDKKGNRSSVKKVYQLMLNQGKIYKVSKHKNNLDILSSSFTSKSIENQNIYDLNNNQISQLVQDLIRNDIKIKSRNRNSNRSNGMDYSRYFVNGKFEYINEYEEDSEQDEECFYEKNSKFEKKYQYMYESIPYEILLYRGLEYIDREKLQQLLKGISSDIKKLLLTRQR